MSVYPSYQGHPSIYEAYGGSGPENYERFFVPTIGEAHAKELIEIAALQPGERVLDVACGTGVVTRLAAQRVGPSGSVTGLDLNPGMIEVARSVTPAEHQIRWIESNAESIPLPDGSFDVVLCQLGLMFMGDKVTALREMRRVLAPHGRLALNVAGPATEPWKILDEEMERHMGSEAAMFVRAVFSLDDPERLAGLVREAGFREVTARLFPKTIHLPPPEAFLWQYVSLTPLASLIRQASEETRHKLQSAIVERWKPFVEGGQTVMPIRTIIVTAVK